MSSQWVVLFLSIVCINLFCHQFILKGAVTLKTLTIGSTYWEYLKLVNRNKMKSVLMGIVDSRMFLGKSRTCPVGEVFVGEVFVGEVFAGEVSVGDVSVGEVSVGEVSVGDVSVGDVSVGNVSVGEVSGRGCVRDSGKYTLNCTFRL